MFNNLMELLFDVPLTLAAGWVAWFVAGALLAVWYRRANAALEMYQALQALPTPVIPRAKSGPRPSAITELRLNTEPRIAAPKPVGGGGPLTAAVPRPKPTPVVVGDPFGDLSTLLNQPAAAAPVSRGSSELQILNSAGVPEPKN